MKAEIVQEKIALALPGAKVEVHDPMQDGQHLQAIVTYSGFADKNLLEQHRMVMNALEKELGAELHALALKTQAP